MKFASSTEKTTIDFEPTWSIVHITATGRGWAASRSRRNEGVGSVSVSHFGMCVRQWNEELECRAEPEALSEIGSGCFSFVTF